MQTTPEELACLAGGPARAAEVALARLLDAGQVRISREGFVTAVQPGHAHHAAGSADPERPAPRRQLRPRPGVHRGHRVEAASLRTHLIDRGPAAPPSLHPPPPVPVAVHAGRHPRSGGDRRLRRAGRRRRVHRARPAGRRPPALELLRGRGRAVRLGLVLGARDPGRMRTRRAYRLVNRAERHVSSTRGPALGTPQYRLNAVAVRGLRSQAALFGLTALAIGVAVHHTNSSSSCGSGCSSSGCGSSDGGGSDGGSSCGGGCGGGGGD